MQRTSVWLILLVLVAVCAPAADAATGVLPPGPLITVWEHSDKVDITPVVREVGFNTVWTHDRPYDGSIKWEDTLMYRHIHTPGVKYVIAKVDRTIWGWTHEQSLRHAEWIAKLSLEHKEIIGLYLNDFYDEVREKQKTPATGKGRTLEEWKEIIQRARSINPKLALFVPYYPHNDTELPFDFDHDAIIFNVYSRRNIPDAERLLVETEKKHPGKPIITGLYLRSDQGTWLSEAEFKQLLGVFIKHLNEGKTVGFRVFRAATLEERPEYMKWTKEMMKDLKAQ